MRTKLLQTFAFGIAFGVGGCSGSGNGSVPTLDVTGGVTGSNPTGGNGPTGSGGSNATGGTAIVVASTGGNNSISTGASPSTGGKAATGGTATGGKAPTGGAATGGAATGGKAPTGGAATGGIAPGGSDSGGSTAGGSATGGTAAGAAATGGNSTNGGAATGGTATNGGAATGGKSTNGGAATGGKSTNGGAATGGKSTNGGAATGGTATGGGASVGGGTSTVNCSATMPTGGTDHCGANTQGNAGGLSWSLWSNAVNSNSCITTFSTSAFSARWSNSSDFLARIGLEWGNGGKTYDQYGTISADFSYTKTGTAGGYSYIGIYGWSTNPCVEYYIVDDSYGTMPFNAYNASLKGTVAIDGENYKIFSNNTTGTGGSRCSGTSNWMQFWSIRQKARQCGTITITKHFDAWKAAGMTLGNLLEAKILVEVGGGIGSINFPVATVTAK